MSLTRTEVSEIIIVSRVGFDLDSVSSDRRVKLIIQPEAGISAARNLGISNSSGDIIAFTDDDCIVSQDWPLLALSHFKDPKVGVVGGPGITSVDDGWRSKCSGAVLSTRVGTSTTVYRYAIISNSPRTAGEKQLSTCNLFLRKSVLRELGYFQTVLTSCEENELIERIRSVGYTVLYIPTVVVYHHRRPLFLPFLEQISNYAMGRAIFTMKWPKYIRPVCLVPSALLVLTLSLPILAHYIPNLANTVTALLLLYLTVIAFAAVESTVKNHLRIIFAPIVFFGIIAMHYCYGLAFLAGVILFKRDVNLPTLTKELRSRCEC